MAALDWSLACSRRLTVGCVPRCAPRHQWEGSPSSNKPLISLVAGARIELATYGLFIRLSAARLIRIGAGRAAPGESNPPGGTPLLGPNRARQGSGPINPHSQRGIWVP
jgi:hypothetical protein